MIDPSDADLADVASHDSSSSEEEEGRFTIGYLPTQEQVAALLEEGPVSTDTLADDIEELIGVAKEILPSVQQCLIQSVQAHLEAQKE